MEYQEAVGAAIESERTACRMTREELAAAAGISVDMVGRHERGEQDPTTARLRAIAAAFGRDPQYLLSRADFVLGRAEARAGSANQVAAGQGNIQVAGNLRSGSGGNASTDDQGVNVAGATVFGDVKVAVPSDDSKG